MSTTKLTLSIPRHVLLEAKAYSHKTGQPLSQIVSRYFLILSKSFRKKHLPQVSAKVQEVTGLAKSHKTDSELLFEALKSKYL